MKDPTETGEREGKDVDEAARQGAFKSMHTSYTAQMKPHGDMKIKLIIGFRAQTREASACGGGALIL